MLNSLLVASVLLSSPIAANVRVIPDTAVVADETIPSTVFVKEKPKDAKDVRESKPAVKVGDKVTLKGRVGGRKEPFVKSRAIFTVADSRLVACNEKPGDTCKFPWDFCCETPESLKANTMTVQIVGADKKPLKVTAENAGGLKPLSKVIVVGVVREVTKEGAFVVDAEQIFIDS